MSECSHDFDSNELSNYCAKGCGETWALYTIKNIKKENDILREALEFYATEDYWEVLREFDVDIEGFEIGDDSGTRAREALEKVRSES